MKTKHTVGENGVGGYPAGAPSDHTVKLSWHPRPGLERQRVKATIGSSSMATKGNMGVGGGGCSHWAGLRSVWYPPPLLSLSLKLCAHALANPFFFSLFTNPSCRHIIDAARHANEFAHWLTRLRQDTHKIIGESGRGLHGERG